MKTLAERIGDRSATVGVVGLGYVGLPLAVSFADVGFEVVGIDYSSEAIAQLRSGEPTTGDIDPAALTAHLKAESIRLYDSYEPLETADAICICVPTPVTEHREPDMSCVRSAAHGVAEYLGRGQLVVLESTTFPGTTDELVRPILEATGLRVGRDFALAYSPERVDPNNRRFGLRNTPKVVGGVTAKCGDLAVLLYSQIVTEVVPVSSPRVAETAKLLENLFRHVNIALVNELALLCDRMGLDVWEVIDAASTKPFGFMRFEPGPGVGGHCVPVDPFYLAWKARSYGFHTRFIELASDVNTSMPRHVVQKVIEALNSRGMSLRGSQVLVLGAAYKGDIADTRESPALRIIPMLHELGAHVSYNDPHVPSLSANGWTGRSEALTDAAVQTADCVLILTKHSSYDYERIAVLAPLIVDTRNALRPDAGSHVFRLAAQPAHVHAEAVAAIYERHSRPPTQPRATRPVLAAEA